MFYLFIYLFVFLSLLSFLARAFKGMLFDYSHKIRFGFAWSLVVFYFLLVSIVYWTILKPREKTQAVYLPRLVKELDNRGRDYAEAFYSSPKTIDAYFLNTTNKRWGRDVYSNEVFFSTEEEVGFNPGIHSPFVPLPSRRGQVVLLEEGGEVAATPGKQVVTSPKNAPGALSSPEVEGIYNVQQSGVFYQLYYFDVTKGTNRAIGRPFNKGHLYSPFYWKGGDVLFYSGVYRKQETFHNALYICKGDDPSIKKHISKSQTLELPITKISGDSRGQLFLYTDPHRDYPILNDMSYYPFSIEAVKEKGGSVYALGYEIKFLELARVYSFNFHPHHPSTLLVVGPKKGHFKNSVFVFELELKAISEKPPCWPRALVLVLLLALTYFLYRALQRLQSV